MEEKLTHAEKRGAIVKNRILLSETNITQVSKKLKVNRKTLYNWFDGTSPITDENIFRIGKIINHDFGIDFPWYKEREFEIALAVSEPVTEYGKTMAEKFETCRQEKDKLQERCIQLLDELNLVKDNYYQLLLKSSQPND